MPSVVPSVADRNSLLNEIAAALSPRLRAALILVALTKNESLVRSGEPIRHVYFPTGGLVSIATLTAEGHAVDLATVAAEGLIGVSVALEDAISSHNAIVRIAGSALRVDAGILRAEIHSNQTVRDKLLAYANRQSIEIAQAVACQCFHPSLARLCRWLLVASSRTRSDVLQITQDSLGQILGLARPVVTKAAIELQDAGAVRCRHGRITILNRSMLERSACECSLVARLV